MEKKSSFSESKVVYHRVPNNINYSIFYLNVYTPNAPRYTVDLRSLIQSK